MRRRAARLARHTLATARMKAVTTVYRRMLLLTYPLQNGPVPVLSPSIPVRFAALTGADMDAYRRFRPGADPLCLDRQRSPGGRCFVGWHEDRIVHECWVATRGRAHSAYLDRDLLLEPGDAYYYGAYTDPAFRGRGVYMSCYSYLARSLQSEGCSRSVALVAPENRAALLLLVRSGLAVRGTYSVIRLGPWRQYRSLPLPGDRLLPLVPPVLPRHPGVPGDRQVAST